MLKINDIVTVKPGTEDPDFGGDLGGWHGRITEIDNRNPDDVLIMIEWDANTLKNMPKDYLKYCFKEGYDHESMALGIADVLLAEQPNFGEDRESVLNALNKEYYWEDFGEQGLRIKDVEDACNNGHALMDHWLKYVKTHVKLPVKAKYIGENTQNLRYGAIVEINGFADADEIRGVIGFAKYDKRRIQVPLCDVGIEDPTSETQALDDYIVWFMNQ